MVYRWDSELGSGRIHWCQTSDLLELTGGKHMPLGSPGKNLDHFCYSGLAQMQTWLWSWLFAVSRLYLIMLTLQLHFLSCSWKHDILSIWMDGQWKLDGLHLKASQSGSRFTGNIVDKSLPKPTSRMRILNQDWSEAEYYRFLLNQIHDWLKRDQNDLKHRYNVQKQIAKKTHIDMSFQFHTKDPNTKNPETAWLKL